MKATQFRSVADTKWEEDVFVLRIAPTLWNVCRWNAERWKADSVFCNSEEAAKVHARQWAGAGTRRAWLIRADGRLTPIE
jgi:hypothetical protein